MNQLVNAALASIKQGDKSKATELLKQAIASNKNDIDAWLVLSALIDQPERKRQCLNRVLTLDPTHKIAREEMLKLDRASMGNMPIPKPARPIQERNIQTPPPLEKPVQSYFPQQTSAPQPPRMQASPPQPVAPQRRVDEPLVFRYPTLILLATYFFAILFCLFNIFAVIIYPTMFLVACGLSLASLASIWVVSAKVEVSEKGIASSRMFGLIHAQVQWNEIEHVISASLGNILELVTKKGSSVKITSQVSGYPTIVKILREKRPDLFDVSSPVRAGSGNENFIQPASAFAGKKVFKKGLWRRFGPYLVPVPFLLVLIRAMFTDKEHIFEASMGALFFLLLMTPPLFDVFELIVMGNKITVISMFDEQEFTARQIREVKIKSVRRRGAVFHFPVVVTEKGKKYSLQGFSEGTEILYGFLLNWWNTYRYQ